LTNYRNITLLLFLIITHQFLNKAYAMLFHTSSIISCEVSIDPKQSLNKELFLTYIIKNTSAHSIELLTWYTPLEGFMSDLFLITNELDEEIPYEGPMFKRTVPSIDDFVTIKAEQAISIKLNLLQSYTIGTGKFQLTLKPKTIKIRIDSKEETIELCKNQSVKFEIL